MTFWVAVVCKVRLPKLTEAGEMPRFANALSPVPDSATAVGVLDRPVKIFNVAKAEPEEVGVNVMV